MVRVAFVALIGILAVPSAVVTSAAPGMAGDGFALANKAAKKAAAKSAKESAKSAREDEEQSAETQKIFIKTGASFHVEFQVTTSGTTTLWTANFSGDGLEPGSTVSARTWTGDSPSPSASSYPVSSDGTFSGSWGITTCGFRTALSLSGIGQTGKPITIFFDIPC